MWANRPSLKSLFHPAANILNDDFGRNLLGTVAIFKNTAKM
jgi:hypothetical protein